MKRKQTIAIMALLSITISLIGVSFASAYRGDYTTKGPNYSEEREALMEQAFETGDYNAWVALMTENGRHPRVVDIVSEENFATFAAAHEAAQNGDYETASQLRAELGLGNGQGMRAHGTGAGYKRGMMHGSGNGLHDGSCTEDGPHWQSMNE
ncbi:MAG: hypothetical protein GXO64_02320 [Candidatus Micrarchaeota archaeon]|nr:hypothetical protein [Candidatus Micrarchaeota archaeon]